MGIMVAGSQHEGKVCEDHDRLKMERRRCLAEGGRRTNRGQAMRPGPEAAEAESPETAVAS